MEKVCPLTLKQILPGLPEAEHGRLVDILEVVDEKLARKLSIGHRLFWVSVPLIMHEEVEMYEQADYDVLVYGGETEEMRYVLDEGWSWPEPSLRFPTFTRAIPRAQPKSPAGLAHGAGEVEGPSVPVSTIHLQDGVHRHGL